MTPLILLMAATAAASAPSWSIDGRPVPGEATLQFGQVAEIPGRFQDARVRFRVRCSPSCPEGVLLAAPDRGAVGPAYWVPLQGNAAGHAQLVQVDAGGNRSDPRPLPLAPHALLSRLPEAAALAAPPAKTPPLPRTPAGEFLVELELKENRLSGRIDGQPLAGGYGFDISGSELYGRFAVVGGAGASALPAAPQVDDLLTVVPLAPERSDPGFEVRKLTDLFYAEGAAVGDLNGDGRPDIVAGPNVFLGPDFRHARRIYLARATAPNAYAQSMLQHVLDVDGDGLNDVLQVGPPSFPAVFYRNPGAASKRWARIQVLRSVASETTVLADLFGDGRRQLVMVRRGSGGMEVGYAAPNPSAPLEPWAFHAVAAAGRFSAHGLGVGDISGDGRPDILNGAGWFEQPAQAGSDWSFHPYGFGDGAEMFVVDVDADGLADVVSTLDAHGWGLAWFRQTRGGGGVSFEKREILSSEGRGPGAVSQLHALAVADFNGDGAAEVVTGKRWWGHLDTSIDPDPDGPSLLYRFDPKRTRGASFTPILLHSNAPVGVQLTAADVNEDGRPDLIVSARKGVFLFINRLRSAR